MGLLSGVSNFLSSTKEAITLNTESRAINDLGVVVAEYQQTKPDRDRAKVNATQLRIVLERQTDKAKVSDIEHLQDKEIKQFERKVTRQLWDLKRIVYNLNIIIRTEYHEMLLEVHKPLQSYSLLIEEFGKIFAKQKDAGIMLDAKQIALITKHFESIKKDYDLLVTNMVTLTKYQLSPVSMVNNTITATHMSERSKFRKEINQSTVSIRTKFVAIINVLKKIKLDPTNPNAVNNNQTVINCLDNAKSQFDGLITLFNQRGKLAKEMVVNAETMRTNTLKEIIELKAVLDTFYLAMQSKNNSTISAQENKILAQLKSWEDKNKEELNKDAYILAEEEEEEKKLTKETQGNMVVMRDNLVNKTNAIIATIAGLTIGAGTMVAATAISNGAKGNTGINITNSSGANSTNNINPKSTGNSNVLTGWDGQTVQSPPKNLKDPSTNLLNQNGLYTDDSRVLSERPAAFDAPKTGILGRLRTKTLSLIMAGVMAFNIFFPATANAIKELSPVVHTVTANNEKYYEEEITINSFSKTGFIFSSKFDNKEGMQYPPVDVEGEIMKQVNYEVLNKSDSVRKDKFSGFETQISIEFHPEKSSVTGTTCPSGSTRNVNGKNNQSLGTQRAVQAFEIVKSTASKMLNNPVITVASSLDSMKLSSKTIYDDNAVELAVKNLNIYAKQINRPDLVANPKLVRQGNVAEVTKFDNCLLIMSKNSNAEYQAKVKNVMNGLRDAKIKLVFVVKMTKIPKDTAAPYAIPFAPVIGPERMVRREEEILTDVKPRYKKPENEKIKPDNWRNVRTGSGGQTRVRPGSTSFITGRQGSRQTQQRKTTSSKNKNRY